MSVFEKLAKVQQELKAPKSQVNNFGKYNYRSCEDILEAVKPLLAKHNAVLMLSDEIVEHGVRVYVKATATFTDCENGEHITNTAYAREEEVKKGADGAQITGAASSYARKYCLNGLFCIDDTKDVDSNEYHQQGQAKVQQTQAKVQPKVQPKPTNYVVTLTTGEIGLFAAGQEDKGPFPISKLPDEALKQALNNPRYASGKAAIEAELEKRDTAKIPF